MPTRGRSARLLLAAALGALALLGVALARTTEPGVRVRGDALDAATGSRVPVVWVEPSGTAHGTALLTHGITASKETLRPLAETLALAGYRCCLADLPGHGASRAARTDAEIAATYAACAAALGGSAEPPHVDVLVGHSFGAYTGARALAAGEIAAEVFVAIGARVDAGDGARRTVFVVGAEDELLRADDLRRHAAEVGAELVVVPLCDHVVEPWHPGVIAATLAAVAPERTVRRRATAERWRVVGWSLLAATVLLALVAAPAPRATGWRAAAVGSAYALGVVALASAATHGVILYAAPTPARLVASLALAGAALFLSAGVSLTLSIVPRVTRRSAWIAQSLLAAFALGLAAAQMWWGEPFLAFVQLLLALVLVAGALVGAPLERRVGSPWAGHAAFAVVVGHVMGTWLGPLLL